jgi:hypothetical protein
MSAVSAVSRHPNVSIGFFLVAFSPPLGDEGFHESVRNRLTQGFSPFKDRPFSPSNTANTIGSILLLKMTIRDRPGWPRRRRVRTVHCKSVRVLPQQEFRSTSFLNEACVVQAKGPRAEPRGGEPASQSSSDQARPISDPTRIHPASFGHAGLRW